MDFHFPWRAKVEESVNASNPVVVGDKVLISECYGPGAAFLKVRPGKAEPSGPTAKRTARTAAWPCHWNTPIHVDGYVYGCSGRHENEAELRCVELATGKVMWQETDLSRCSLTLIDGHFLCLSETGELMLLKVNPKRFEPGGEVDDGSRQSFLGGAGGVARLALYSRQGPADSRGADSGKEMNFQYFGSAPTR